MQNQRHLFLALLAVLVVAPACADDDQSAADSGVVSVDANGGDAQLPDPDASTANVPRSETALCKFTVPDSLGFTEGAEYECGDLVVYENRDEPTATIKVHYIRFHSSSASNNMTIYLDGGPGGNGNNIVQYVGFLGQSFLDAITVDGDFMVISQRGTSLSEPALLCDDPGCSDMPGYHIPSYNTAFNADDVDDLRSTLGFDKMNLYGISYGSRLGLEVMRRHPDNIRASIIGGLVPAQINWPAHIPSSFYSALTGLNASCVAHGGCATAFGDLEAKFISAFDKLNATSLSWDYMGDTITMDGWTLSSLLFRVMYSKSSYPWLPIVISDMDEGRTDRVGDYLGELFNNFGGGSNLSTGLYYGVVCNELFNPVDSTAFDVANAAVPTAIRDMYSYNWYGMLSTCEDYPLGPERPTLSQTVTSDVRTFVSSGALDPITPPAFGDLAAASLTNAHAVTYANSGHGATLQSACGQSTFLAFLADPSATPDTSCAASVSTEYVLPAMSSLFAASLFPVNRAAMRFELSIAPPLPPMMQALLRKAIQPKKK